MLSSSRLRFMIMTLMVSVLFAKVVSAQEAMNFFATLLGFVGVLALSIRNDDQVTLKVKTKNSDSPAATLDIVYTERMKTDAPFAQAVQYVSELNPHDLVMFAKLISEIRYESDQDVLRRVARIFKSETNRKDNHQ